MKYTIQKEKICDFLREHNVSRQQLADILNITYASALRKITGDSEFTQSEIKSLKLNFKLTPEEVDKIFFEDE